MSISFKHFIEGINGSVPRAIVEWNAANDGWKLPEMALEQSRNMVRQIFNSEPKQMPRNRIRAKLFVGYLLRAIIEYGHKSVMENEKFYDDSLRLAFNITLWATDKTNDTELISSVDSVVAEPTVKPPKLVTESSTVVASGVAQAAEKATGKRGRAANPNSPSALSKTLYASLFTQGLDRNKIIARFMSDLGLPQGTATTYYCVAKNAYSNKS